MAKQCIADLTELIHDMNRKLTEQRRTFEERFDELKLRTNVAEKKYADCQTESARLRKELLSEQLRNADLEKLLVDQKSLIARMSSKLRDLSSASISASFLNSSNSNFNIPSSAQKIDAAVDTEENWRSILEDELRLRLETFARVYQQAMPAQNGATTPKNSTINNSGHSKTMKISRITENPVQRSLLPELAEEQRRDRQEKYEILAKKSIANFENGNEEKEKSSFLTAVHHSTPKNRRDFGAKNDGNSLEIGSIRSDIFAHEDDLEFFETDLQRRFSNLELEADALANNFSHDD